MIYPMMLKIDFTSILGATKKPKGLIVTCVTNWLIKPFTMYAIAAFFFYVLFKGFIAPDLAKEYLAEAVLLGAAPCTAMVFVWSYLSKGDSAYTLVQVAVNDLIILVAFAPIVAFLLGVSDVSVPMNTLLLSTVLLYSQFSGPRGNFFMEVKVGIVTIIIQRSYFKNSQLPVIIVTTSLILDTLSSLVSTIK